MRDNKRYQLVVPYMSDRVYEVQSLEKGSKKCYNELKSQPNFKTLKEFSIIDIDTLETFRFAITKNRQIGGEDEGEGDQEVQIDADSVIKKGEEIKQESQLDRIEKKLDDLMRYNRPRDLGESMPQIGHVYETNMHKLQAFETLQKDEKQSGSMCQLM